MIRQKNQLNIYEDKFEKPQTQLYKEETSLDEVYQFIYSELTLL